ncbi:sigma 54-interacting transcriptional regulator [Sulfurimonas sp. HSL-1716]|uniref:sigma 54-interacting transcriptional regulator n=1 Tax=Hydrocurvibacter sulfurireducens TaxID=3131937 RepID=UPI0031F9F490
MQLMMIVVVLAATVAVAVTKFITASNASKEAFKTVNLLKTLTVNTLIYGERGTGKKTLAKYIVPNASVIDASSFEELLTAIESSNEIIITNIDSSPNIQRVFQAIKNKKIRVIATCASTNIGEMYDDIFSVKLDLPPLSKRMEDVEALIDIYLEEIKEIVRDDVKFNKSNFIPDVSDNSISLKKQIFSYSFLENITVNELMHLIENYLEDKIGTNNDYRNNLYLYEVPLIRAGLKKFKSQLQLADKLGLNRNTLRKKISENSEYGL